MENAKERDIGELQHGCLERETRDDPRTRPSIHSSDSRNDSAKDFLLPVNEFSQSRWQFINWRFSGWRSGVLSYAFTALRVLLVNVILLIWASAKYGIEDGYGVLHQGNCGKARTISTTLHVLINILSTILLGASDYNMQCLN